MKRWMLAAGVAALLGGCAVPASAERNESWLLYGQSYTHRQYRYWPGWHPHYRHDRPCFGFSCRDRYYGHYWPGPHRALPLGPIIRGQHRRGYSHFHDMGRHHGIYGPSAGARSGWTGRRMHGY